MAPTTTKRWTVEGRGSFDNLKFREEAEIPKLGDHNILVHFHAASLNYRDLIIAKVPSNIQIRASLLPSQTPLPL